MKIKIIFICLAATALFTSCHKYLDIKPKGSLIPTTVADYEHLLDFSSAAVYNFIDNNNGSLISSLGDNITISEGQGKVGYVGNSHPNVDRWWAFLYRQPYTNPISSDYFWGDGSWGIYTMVNYWNNIIEGIHGLNDLSPTDQAYGNSVIAQALVNRSWSYFIGNLLYGPVYKPGGDNNTKTMPYVVHSDFSSPMPDLSTQQQMMTNVMNDLYTALPNLPDASPWPTRPNKALGQAMLAYCHLFTQKYDSVLYYSNLAWTSAAGNNPSKILYDYNKFTFAKPESPVISAINSTQDNYVNTVNSREMLYYRQTDTYAGLATGLSYPSDEFLALIDSTTDLRFKFYMFNGPGYKTSAGGGYDDGAKISYYRTQKVKTTEGMSYPEVLLMRAEAYARLNQLPQAIADLNLLRANRYKTGTPDLTVGTQDEVIQQVLNERRRELPLGGIRRYLDLKRLVLDNGKPWSKKTITHTVAGQTYTGTVDSKDFILPISNSILQFNPQWGIPLDTRPW